MDYFKKGDWAGTDKILVGDLKTKIWTEYKFTPETIEESKLWKSSKTHLLLNYCCAESYINKISNGEIVVFYKFRIDEKKVHLMETRKITYQLDIASGQPNMIAVTAVQ